MHMVGFDFIRLAFLFCCEGKLVCAALNYINKGASIVKR